MTDHLAPAQRSALMSRIRGKNTLPEMIVRGIAHAMGLRLRVHRPDLPGTPDLVFPRRRAVVFVHGCWWHRHSGCGRANLPRTRPEYWGAKFARNVVRDAAARCELEAAGWLVETIWECETRDPAIVRCKLEPLRHRE